MAMPAVAVNLSIALAACNPPKASPIRIRQLQKTGGIINKRFTPIKTPLCMGCNCIPPRITLVMPHMGKMQAAAHMVGISHGKEVPALKV